MKFGIGKDVADRDKETLADVALGNLSEQVVHSLTVQCTILVDLSSTASGTAKYPLGKTTCGAEGSVLSTVVPRRSRCLGEAPRLADDMVGTGGIIRIYQWRRECGLP